MPKKLIALIKAYRGGEWLQTVLESIRGVDAVVIVQNNGWSNEALPNNCKVHDYASPVHELHFDAERQEDQYRFGLEFIRSEFGDDAGVLVVDTDEVWESGGVAALRATMEETPSAHYFQGHIRTYLRSPLYQVWPYEPGGVLVGLQNAKEQPVQGRFNHRMKPTKSVPGVVVHHFPYVRKDESEIPLKFAATSSQEKIASNKDWITRVWPNLPRGTNLHMTPGYENYWRGIRVLPETPVTCPSFCHVVTHKESTRWRQMLEADSPKSTLIPLPTDLSMYPDYWDSPVPIGKIKTTTLEALCLQRLAKTCSSILEIGCGVGGSLAVMGLTSPDADLTAIDPFELYSEQTHAGLAVGVHEGDRDAFWRTMEDHGLRVRLIEKRSSDALESLGSSQFDLVFVDGNHSYNNVREDLANYWPRVRYGGVLVGHDYTTRFPGVVSGVKDSGIPYEVIAGTSLFVARKTQA